MESTTNLKLEPGDLWMVQSFLLEKTFQERSTLTSDQRQELADCLNLIPPEVEAWFQNRRGRMKQEEMDREILKRLCESMADENRRLKKEIQKLKSSETFCSCCKTNATGEGVHVSPRFITDTQFKCLQWLIDEALSASSKLHG